MRRRWQGDFAAELGDDSCSRRGWREISDRMPSESSPWSPGIDIGGISGIIEVSYEQARTPVPACPGGLIPNSRASVLSGPCTRIPSASATSSSETASHSSIPAMWCRSSTRCCAASGRTSGPWPKPLGPSASPARSFTKPKRASSEAGCRRCSAPGPARGAGTSSLRRCWRSCSRFAPIIRRWGRGDSRGRCKPALTCGCILAASSARSGSAQRGGARRPDRHQHPDRSLRGVAAGRPGARASYRPWAGGGDSPRAGRVDGRVNGVARGLRHVCRWRHDGGDPERGLRLGAGSDQFGPGGRVCGGETG